MIIRKNGRKYDAEKLNTDAPRVEIPKKVKKKGTVKDVNKKKGAK